MSELTLAVIYDSAHLHSATPLACCEVNPERLSLISDSVSRVAYVDFMFFVCFWVNFSHVYIARF